MLALVLLSEETPEASNPWFLWGFLIFLGFFFLMVIVGWWVSRNKPEAAAEEVHETHGSGHAETHEEKAADDLKSLEGIGPKVEKVLNESGIHTFADLASADAAKVQETLDNAGMQYMDPTGWIAQAKLAAAGDMDGLAKLQDELKGGRVAS